MLYVVEREDSHTNIGTHKENIGKSFLVCFTPVVTSVQRGVLMEISTNKKTATGGVSRRQKKDDFNERQRGAAVAGGKASTNLTGNLTDEKPWKKPKGGATIESHSGGCRPKPEPNRASVKVSDRFSLLPCLSGSLRNVFFFSF